MSNRNRQVCRRSLSRLESIGFGCLLTLFLPPFFAHADDTNQQANELSTEQTRQKVSLGPLGNATRLSSTDLDTHRAKARLEVHKVTINDQDLNGQVNGNTAINTKTGDNIVSSGAFTNSSGFISTVQNSGNNVLIQNSTIVNVEIDP